jgi:type I restriction enzyme, S subunit
MKGWVTKRLGEACRFIDYRGRTPEKTQSGLRLITAKNVKMGFLQREPLEFVAPESYDAWMTRGIPREGDVLFTTEAPLANVTQLDTDERVVFAQRIIILQPVGQDLDRTFLKYLLLSDTMQATIREKGTGATVQGIKASLLKEIEISFPPLAEQQRIVGVLDEAFEGLATARANAEKNLQNARALFESHLQSVFTRRGPGWGEKRLEDVCVIGDGNHSSNYPKKEELVAEGVPFIRATNLVEGEISDDDMRFLSPEKHAQLRKGHLKSGDILFTNRGEIGKTAIVDADHDGSNLNSQIAWLRCSETLNNRFLFHVLNSGAIKSHLELSKNGAALQQFTIRQIKELKIPIPLMDQQKALVVSLDGLSEETQRLARLYERKLAALEALKKALLHQAFAGEL